ncbi:unnamed protein product [Merluccius merluccius]
MLPVADHCAAFQSPEVRALLTSHHSHRGAETRVRKTDAPSASHLPPPPCPLIPFRAAGEEEEEEEEGAEKRRILYPV